MFTSHIRYVPYVSKSRSFVPGGVNIAGDIQEKINTNWAWLQYEDQTNKTKLFMYHTNRRYGITYGVDLV